jgi:hypothetical protein
MFIFEHDAFVAAGTIARTEKGFSLGKKLELSPVAPHAA